MFSLAVIFVLLTRGFKKRFTAHMCAGPSESCPEQIGHRLYFSCRICDHLSFVHIVCKPECWRAGNVQDRMGQLYELANTRFPPSRAILLR